MIEIEIAGNRRNESEVSESWVNQQINERERHRGQVFTFDISYCYGKKTKGSNLYY
jgi:hypothetical protein